MSFDLRLTINGAPLVADLDPNASAPTLDRVFTTPLKAGSASNGPVQILGILGNGTSCNFTVWVYSPELLAWFKLGDTTNVLARQLGVIGNVPCNADVFVQLTNIVGAPTRFGVGVGYGSKSQDQQTESTSWKQPVRLATIAALPACALVGNRLTGNVNGVIPPATTDGFAVAVTNDILVKNQGGIAAHLQDGPYRVVDEGLAGGGGRPWILDRTPHCDESSEVFDGMMVTVGEGLTLTGHVFEQVTDAPITINVTALEFRDLGTLLALVTAAASGTVNAYGAAAAGSVFTNGAPTVGGAWPGFLRAFTDYLETSHTADYGVGAAPDTRIAAASNSNVGGSGGRLFLQGGLSATDGGVFIMDPDGVTGRIAASQSGDVFFNGNSLVEASIGGAANVRFQLHNADAYFYVPDLRIGPAVAATTIGYAADIVTGGARPQLTHVGQDSTVAGSTGGPWRARAGHGVAAHGVLALMDANGQDRLTVTNTDGLIFNGTTTDFFNAGAVTATGNPSFDFGTNTVDVDILRLGNTPSAVGNQRWTDGFSLAYRDPAGPTDRCALSVSGGIVTVGGAAVGVRPTTIYIDAATSGFLQRGGQAALLWDSSAIQLYYATLNFRAATGASTISHTDTAVAGATAVLTTFRSQGCTDATAPNFANGLLLKGGDVAGIGASTAGPVERRAGSATAAGVGSQGGYLLDTVGSGAANGYIEQRGNVRMTGFGGVHSVDVTPALVATLTLVAGLSSQVQIVTAAGAQDVILPAVTCTGAWFWIESRGAGVLTIKNPAAATITTLTTLQGCYVKCHGGAWLAYGKVLTVAL